jgi:hypothetical protein
LGVGVTGLADLGLLQYFGQYETVVDAIADHIKQILKVILNRMLAVRIGNDHNRQSLKKQRILNNLLLMQWQIKLINIIKATSRNYL